MKQNINSNQLFDRIIFLEESKVENRFCIDLLKAFKRFIVNEEETNKLFNNS